MTSKAEIAVKLAPPISPIERLPGEWRQLLESWGQPPYRAAQIFRWIQRRGVLDPERMTDLPQELRARLRDAGVDAAASLVDVRVSGDGTRKLLVGMADGCVVETVLIPYGAGAGNDLEAPEDYCEADHVGDADDGGVTQCISCQAGCAMGCVFCASGTAGLKRQLSAAEIVSQVLIGKRVLGESRLRGAVLMGMGEPLHNYEAVARALVLLSHPGGIGLSTRRITVSTCGLVSQIDRLGRDFGGRVQLAVSLHASDDRTRSRLMPINRKYPLGELIAALKRYPLPRRRRITIEYILIQGTNDSYLAARNLAELLHQLRVKVNLIPMNSVPGSELRASSQAAVNAFQRRLLDAGISAFIRRPRGRDIAAACGQLALQYQ